MSRHFSRGFMWLAGLSIGTTAAIAGADESRPNRPDAIVAAALRSNPVTAPYEIRVGMERGRVVLSGRVGTNVIHDVAVRTVLDLGYPLRDDLVIDTGEVHRVAMEQAIRAGTLPAPGQPVAATSSPYFVYPEPLFGRVDDPFFGMEPPLLSLPPRPSAAPGLDPRVAPAGSRMPAPGRAAAGAPVQRPGPVNGQLRLTVDAAGQVFLSGVVASEEDRRIIEAEARNTPGVSRVFSELRVASRSSDTPPPPPTPYAGPDDAAQGAKIVPAPPDPAPAGQQQPPAAPRPPAPDPSKAGLAMARDTQALSRLVAEALSRRPALAPLPIGVSSRGDVVTISGKVPTAYEAMLTYRAVEQTPGVREVVDQLQFQVPDEDHPNPLRQKARPDDLEPYLTSQVRRHLGDIAHVDRIRIRGDRVELRGTLLRADDRKRAEATIRSMPLLRDFQVDAVFDVQ
ncbi:BON domain protein [Aquisphaera giovannonii]|uniref:BON domain protein n=1 Tax=Aquisphaera giovannonii TaxID=406548 RepID=A0A5B9W7F1_9BACT|nr:BON domain-containing protein [Aquisphaera giovannonii]QEH36277.1 BON domain protein [Aquisphaera giovannonii]